MKDYTKYEVVDFLLDDSFVKWASGKSQNMEDFWVSWAASYPERSEIFNQAKEIAAGLKVVPSRKLSSIELSEMVNNITSRIETSKEETIQESGTEVDVRWYQQSWMKIAASVLLICSAALLIYFNSGTQNLLFANQEKVWVNEKSAAMLVRLPDNSSVILKPGSKLSYSNTQFNKENREVFLKGEAFFEVTKDKQRPFLVYTGELVTKVLGTSFLIKAFNGDKEFKVIVNTGKVSVFPKKNSEKQLASKSLDKGKGVLITPNQEVTFNRVESRLIKKKLIQPAVLSEEVTRNTFNFVETPFSEVISALSKAYEVKINYDQDKMSACPLTASLTNQDLNEKLKLICNAVEADYQIVEGEIVIKGKGCN